MTDLHRAAGSMPATDVLAYSIAFGSLGFAVFLIQAIRQFSGEDRVVVVSICLFTWAGGLIGASVSGEESIITAFACVGATMLGIVIFSRGRVDSFINLAAYFGDLGHAETQAHDVRQFKIVLCAALLVGVYFLGRLALQS